MRWNVPSLHNDSSSEALARCRQPILAVVQSEAAEDLSVKRGIARAAEVFGMPYERVRAYYHNAVRRPTADEFLRIRRTYRTWCWDKQMQLAHRIERLRQEIRELGEDE